MYNEFIEKKFYKIKINNFVFVSIIFVFFIENLLN